MVILERKIIKLSSIINFKGASILISENSKVTCQHGTSLINKHIILSKRNHLSANSICFFVLQTDENETNFRANNYNVEA